MVLIFDDFLDMFDEFDDFLGLIYCNGMVFVYVYDSFLPYGKVWMAAVREMAPDG